MHGGRCSWACRIMETGPWTDTVQHTIAAATSFRFADTVQHTIAAATSFRFAAAGDRGRGLGCDLRFEKRCAPAAQQFASSPMQPPRTECCFPRRERESNEKELHITGGNRTSHRYASPHSTAREPLYAMLFRRVHSSHSTLFFHPLTLTLSLDSPSLATARTPC